MVDQEDSVPDPLVVAVGHAAQASAEQQSETVKALRFYRRSFWVVVIAVLILIGAVGFGVYQFKEYNDRSATNSKVLLCQAQSERTIAIDIHNLKNSKNGKLTGPFPVPAECSLPKQ